MASASSTGGPEPAAASVPPKAAESPPKTLGKYRLRKKIGAGGMGAVYLADDTQLKRTVALKVLPREKATNETLVKRFKSEAQSAAQLKHDNIVTVYEAGEADGYLFIALEYVEGTDVFKLVAGRGLLPVKRSLDIVKQVARALQHAHQRNIVHRDIKPSNLLIQRNGQVKLTDMGLARTIDDEAETGITRAGMTVGTVDYMAPEQARDSKAADIRSDIYSLGCTWYHMLTGAPPFADGSMTTKLYNHAAKSRPDPRDKNEAIPESVVEVMHRMMARKPADRYQTPTELLADLEGLGVRPVSTAEKLLATISDAVDSETNDEVKATAAAGNAPSSRKAVKIPDSPDLNRPWLKYLVGLGVFGGFAVLIWWISNQFASVFDSGGVVVDRDGGRDHADVEARSTPRQSPAQVAVTGDDSPPQTADGDRGASGDSPARSPAAERPVGISLAPTTDPKVLERIRIGREGERPYVPVWTADMAKPGQPAAGAGKPNAMTVGRVSDEISQFADLNAALDNLPPTGGVVQLIGSGPFDLNPIQIKEGQELSITGDAKSLPVIVLQPDAEKSDRPVVTVSGGSLTLLNVQLATTAERFGDEGPVTLFDVRGGDLAMRQCSVTLLGNRQGATSAIRTSPHSDPKSAASPARVLLDRTFIRGSNLTALSAGGAPCDVVASNCLFVTGDAPIVRISGSATSATGRNARGSAAQQRPARSLRFISCTGAASHTAFELAPGSSSTALLPTGILTLNSLFSASQSDGDRTFAALGGWPRRENPGTGESPFVNLNWMVRSSVFLGWNAFLRHDEDPQPALNDVLEWQKQRNELVDNSRFAGSLPWPAALPDAPSAAEPPLFDAATTGVAGVAATDDGAPGCQIAAIVSPEPEMLRRVAGLAESPVVPPSIFQNSDPVRVSIDLDKEDLGKVVSDGRSGTLFVASGAGSHNSSPIRLRGKSIRIEFHQTPGLPLQISPRAVNSKAIENDTLADAFVSIDDGGRLEISHAHFRIPHSTTTRYPKWLLAAREGSFTLENCVLEGPLVGNSRNDGLICWERTGGAPVKPLAAGRYEQYGQIRNSYLKGAGKLLRLDIAGRALIVTNSLLVSTDSLFDIDLKGEGPRIRGSLSLDRTTLSARETFFRLSGGSLGEKATHSLRLIVSHTVFAPPVGGAGRKEPTLLSYNAAAIRDERQMEWWGLANGYTHLLGKYLDGPAEGDANAGGFDEGWRNAWDTAACLRPLAGSGAVALKNRLPAVSRLAPADFELDPASKGAKWTADGEPIGAALGTLAQAGPESPAETRPPAETQPQAPRKPKF